MIILFIKTAFRNLLKNRGVFIINLLNLSLGLTITLYISIYVIGQLNVDKTFENYNNIYRLEMEEWEVLPCGLAPVLADRFPDLETYVRIGSTRIENTLESDNHYFSTSEMMFLDGKPFDVFDFKFVYGSPDNALSKPSSLVLTKSMMKRIFGNINPLGKIVILNNDIELTVTGVIEDTDNTHFRVDALADFETLRRYKNMTEQQYSGLKGAYEFLTYYVLSSNNNIELGKSIDKWLEETGVSPESEKPGYWFRPISNIYLNNNLNSDFGIVHGSLQNIKGMILVGILILLIASINYINISTAQGLSRSKEIGLRKVMGSDRKTLIGQLLTESFLLSLIAFFLAIICIWLLYPLLSNRVGIDLPSMNLLPNNIYLIFCLIFLTAGLLGGIYPALYLSSVAALEAFSVKLSSVGKGRNMRRSLIVFQLAVALFLTVQAIIVLKQYFFLRDARYSYDIENILALELPDGLRPQYYSFREELLKCRGIENVASTAQEIGNVLSENIRDISETNKRVQFKMLDTDPEFLNVFDVEVIAGRFFTRERESDRKYRAFVINETAANELGLSETEAIGYRLSWFGGSYIEIIGVIKDFHYNSLIEPVEPLIITWYESYRRAYIKLEAGKIQESLEDIESVWTKFEPDKPLKYSFVGDTMAKHYRAQEKLSQLTVIFAILAILIAVSGIFGMSMFMAKQLVKKVGIQKAMGASILSVITGFTKEFVIMALIATILAVPLSYFYAAYWLEQFPYKPLIPVWVFVVSVCIILSVTFLTSLYYAIKSATRNPAEVLSCHK